MPGPAHHRTAFDGAAGHTLSWCHLNERRQGLGIGKAPHIARIGQHLGHRGLSNAGNTVEQLGITLQIGVAINVGVDVAFKIINLLPQLIQMRLYGLDQQQLPTGLMRFQPVAFLLVHIFERLQPIHPGAQFAPSW